MILMLALLSTALIACNSGTINVAENKAIEEVNEDDSNSSTDGKWQVDVGDNNYEIEIKVNRASANAGDIIVVEISEDYTFDYKYVENSLKYNGIPIINGSFRMPSEDVLITAESEKIEYPCSKGLEYDVIDDQIYITGMGTFKGDHLVIPAKTDKFGTYLHAYVNIAADAFRGNTTIKTVTIPSSVEIGEYAFAGCTSLEKVIVTQAYYDDKVAGVGKGGFQGCTNLADFDMEGSEERYYVGINKSRTFDFDDLAFDGCNKMMQLDFPISGHVIIRKRAILGAENLNILRLNEGNVFFDHEAVVRSNFVLYQKGEDIGNHVNSPFALINTENGNNLDKDGYEYNYIDGILYKMKGDEAIVYNYIEKSILNIPETVRINNNKYTVTAITDHVFYDKESLTSLYIPRYVEEVKITYNDTYSNYKRLGMFTNSPKMHTININRFNTHYKSVDNCIVQMADKRLIAGIKTSIIPKNGEVEIIGERAFYGIDIKNIVLAESIEEIEYEAFNYCTELETVVIESVYYYNCSSCFWGSSNPNFYFIDYPFYAIEKLINVGKINGATGHLENYSADYYLYSKTNVIDYPYESKGLWRQVDGVATIWQ